MELLAVYKVLRALCFLIAKQTKEMAAVPHWEKNGVLGSETSVENQPTGAGMVLNTRTVEMPCKLSHVVVVLGSECQSWGIQREATRNDLVFVHPF